MATLTPTLTLASTDAFANQPISLSVTDSLTIAAPYTDISKVGAATGGTTILATSQAVVSYVYVKNTGKLAADGNTTTNLVTVAQTDGDVATLAAGEFMFMPLTASKGLTVTSASAAVFVEYAYFSKG